MPNSTTTTTDDAILDRAPEELAAQFRAVRSVTDRLCEPLEIEDYCVQSMPDASPIKWHLAHTTWFFETFILKRLNPNYRSPDPQYEFLFNSYYNTVGEQYSRPDRGVISRPTVSEVKKYRDRVNADVEGALESDDADEEVYKLLEIGIHHEQQHQELMLMDLKHAFSLNPLFPAYKAAKPRSAPGPAKLGWVAYEGELEWIGHHTNGFSYDNECPRHKTYVESVQFSDRLITCGEYQEFIDDQGYARPELWLADGWRVLNEQGWECPLYWTNVEGEWNIMTLGGRLPLDPLEPVSHVSFYEADAFARWRKSWLPRESAWEAISHRAEISSDCNLLESGLLRPEPVDTEAQEGVPRQVFGDLWEWTCSPYVAYPGYRPEEGALGEYNGKFMCNQMVLRGGSYATPQSHLRRTYRNFYPAEARWPFTGIRLTKESI